VSGAIEVVPVAGFPVAAAAAAMVRCFEGYVVPVRISPEGWERRFRAEHLDPFASRIYLRGKEAAAVVFVTRRGWTSRIGGMGVAAGERGRGLGRRVMEEAIDAAWGRGDRRLILEVIEQNPPAVALYRSLGFRATRRLVGWEWASGAAYGVPGDAIEEVDVAEVARVVAREGEPELPWMLAAETVAGLSAPAAGFHLGENAWAVVADPAAAPASLTTLVVPRGSRRRGWGRRIVGALDARFPGRAWGVTSVVPEGMADGFAASIGGGRRALTQWEMVLDRPPGR
jgi:ribosomal protein S18 acetylase RimI-like enzyme